MYINICILIYTIKVGDQNSSSVKSNAMGGKKTLDNSNCTQTPTNDITHTHTRIHAHTYTCTRTYALQTHK